MASSSCCFYSCTHTMKSRLKKKPIIQHSSLNDAMLQPGRYPAENSTKAAEAGPTLAAVHSRTLQQGVNNVGICSTAASRLAMHPARRLSADCNYHASAPILARHTDLHQPPRLQKRHTSLWTHNVGLDDSALLLYRLSAHVGTGCCL